MGKISHFTKPKKSKKHKKIKFVDPFYKGERNNQRFLHSKNILVKSKHSHRPDFFYPSTDNLTKLSHGLGACYDFWISCIWRSQYWYTNLFQYCIRVLYQYCDLKKYIFYLCIVLWKCYYQYCQYPIQQGFLCVQGSYIIVC